ncbi:phosphatidate cytidylyltransferase [Nitratifractor salsuginis]|uniref:Phosphatidate cytidylyltransferase n=1 Tax=Nitratifractor salsuginis (strain DSM 16511 / JCM 12458 / E9I37-1) TaxID=749222 RepID=E6WZ53_NITSE|nr:phosphatidate cytidylyltransferase [Nitratifractor salsuginis]ADV45503.1 phosphatidate cytidylyltransferase [Nitratifractor salsuginis DSM 16511]
MAAPDEHSQRWKTALILLGLIALVGFIDNTFLTWLFLGVVYALALPEAMRLFRTAESTLYLYAGGLWLLGLFYPHPTDLIFGAAAIFGSLLAYNKRLEIRAFFPLLYPTAGMLFLWMLYRDFGMISLFWILIIVALTDVGAYYTGRKLGKTPFSPTSPKKTLEGVFGGIAAGTLGGALLMMGHKGILLSAILIALLTATASVFGDLFESYLKREASVKDSGDILPGHGGILDRIDGYLFASIALYILLKMTGA